MRDDSPRLEFPDDAELIFISDTHLDLNQLSWRHQLNLLAQLIARKKPAALFILGDFIDGWIGQKHTNRQPLSQLKSILHQISNTCPIYFMPGNRDCLMHSSECEQLSMQFIPDPTIIQYQNRNIALTHGDLWCINDRAHLRFRKIAGHPFTAMLLAAAPTKLVTVIRNLTKTISARHKTKIELHHSQPIWRELKKHCSGIEIDQIIHGHTHLFENTPIRINLGHWPDDQSKISYYSTALQTHTQILIKNHD